MRERAPAYADQHVTSVTFLGDSITAGLGARGRSYPALVAESLGCELDDRSMTGWTVAESLECCRQRPCDSDVVVIAHGVTEPIRRPVVEDVRWLPRRWRRLGWMDPRPYYSSRRVRRLMERIESGVRWRVKNALLARRGSVQLLALDDYVAKLGELIELLVAGGSTVFVLSPPPISDRFFPGSPRLQNDYYEAAQRALPSIPFITVHHLHRWDDFLEDDFHPNVDGHEKIAEAILSAVLHVRVP